MRYFILIGVVITIVGAWTGAWFYIAGGVRSEIQAVVSQSTPSRMLGHDGVEVGGFPYRIKVDIAAPRAALLGDGMDFRWATDKVSAVRHLWQPNHVLLELAGQHRFELSQNGAVRKLVLDNREARASVETGTGGRLDRLSLDITAPSLQDNGALVLRGRRLQVHVRMTPDAADSIDLALRGDDLELDDGLLPPDLAELAGLARDISLLDVRTTVTGLPPNTATATPFALWRDGGGTVEVRQFHLVWGSVEITASGSLALDDRMRPIGALTARIRGHDELLDFAVKSGAMSKNSRAAAGAVLGLLAAAAGGVLSVPVRLQDGQLFLGPVAVAKLMPLALR
jgi:hypothetical protein